MIVAISEPGGIFQVSERNEKGTYTQWFMYNASTIWREVEFPDYYEVMRDHNDFGDIILFNDDPNSR